jgi:flagellar basal-body rod protein FlgB
MNIDDPTLKALASALNYRQMRQEVISSNVANAETPGYKAKRVDFESALARALDIEKQNSLNTDDKGHFNVGGGGFDNLEPTIYDDPNGEVSETGNTVNRDQELAMMAKNKIMFDATVQLINKKLGLLKYIVTNER